MIDTRYKNILPSIRPDATVLAMKLQEFLALNGMTQREFAQAANMTEATVSRLCTGKHRPQYPTIRKIFLVTNGDVAMSDFMKEPGK